METPIRLLSVGHSYVVALNRAILREIAKDPDFDVSVVAPKLFKGSLRPIEVEPEPAHSPLKVFPVSAYWTQKMHFFRYDQRQLKKVFGQGHDLLHIWEEPYIVSGYQVAKLAHDKKIPFLFRTAQSLIKNYIFPFNVFERRCFQWAKRWVAGGGLVYKAMVDKGWDGSKGKVLTLAVDTHRFQPFDDQAKEEARRMLKLEGPVIGYLGRLSEEKGLDILMNFMTRLKDKKWSLLIMGSGPYEKKIIQWANSENISQRVKVKLYDHERVPEVLPVCDMLVCPSQTRPFWKEQFGRMIVEAFAAGVPVVGSDSGEIPHVIDEAGIVVPESNAELWAEAVGDLLDYPEKRNELRRKGLIRVERFSAKAIAEQYKEFYKGML